MNTMNINEYIDHTILKADASKAEVETLCQEAKEHQFKSVCINPTWVSLAKEMLADTSVLVCTVIGFPLGANHTDVKVYETKKALEEGADEIDMVINVAQLKAGNEEYVKNEIAEISKEVHQNNGILKVIIETSLLTDEEKIKACSIAKDAGADFVKTSTGFSSSGATVEDIKLMRKTVGEKMGVKASGGVRELDFAMELIGNGATRLGTSSGVKLVNKNY